MKKTIIKFSLPLAATIFSILMTSCSSARPEATPSTVTFMKNGYTDYAILLPSKCQEYEAFAATELQQRVEDASQMSLSILTEGKDNLSSDVKYISLGETNLYKSTHQDNNLTSIDGTQSAYYRDYKNGNLYLVSSDDFRGAGVLYGVYDLLEELCDYKYFASDEMYVQETRTMHFIEKKNQIVRPSFDSRTISIASTLSDSTLNKRMRTIIPGVSNSEWAKAVWGHGQITYYVPFSEYGLSHPEWYMNSSSAEHGNQLCLSAGEEMENIVFEKFKKFISEDKTATYFMFAQQDIQSGCTCDKCNEAKRTWAKNYQGIQVDFMNRMIDRVEAWLQETEPGRTIYYVVFAYQHTLEAPIDVDSNGDYHYHSERVIPHEKLRFVVAPVGANYTFNFESPVNSDILVSLKQWKFYGNNHYIIYLYDTNFKNYFINFNNFGAIRDMLETCKENGTYYFLTQGCSDARSGCFNELRLFVEANLGWDVTRSYEELKDDFMLHYYKDASEPMNYIFEMIRDQYAIYDSLYSRPKTQNIYANLLSTDLWPYNSVRQMQNKIREALASIEHYGEENPDLYVTLSNRIYKEYLTVIYLKVKLYNSYITDGEKEELKAIWEKYTQLFGFSRESEGSNAGIDIF